MREPVAPPEISTQVDDANEPVDFPLPRRVRRLFRRGSRAHIGRLPGGRKAPPSLATHLAIPTDTGTVRVWHPDYLQRLEDARADAVPDDGKGLRR